MVGYLISAILDIVSFINLVGYLCKRTQLINTCIIELGKIVRVVLTIVKAIIILDQEGEMGVLQDIFVYLQVRKVIILVVIVMQIILKRKLLKVKLNFLDQAVLIMVFVHVIYLFKQNVLPTTMVVVVLISVIAKQTSKDPLNFILKVLRIHEHVHVD